jgi:hypothetical protein
MDSAWPVMKPLFMKCTLVDATSSTVASRYFVRRLSVDIRCKLRGSYEQVPSAGMHCTDMPLWETLALVDAIKFVGSAQTLRGTLR